MSDNKFTTDPRLYAMLGRFDSIIVDQHLLEEGYREDKEDGGLTIFIPNWNHRVFLPRAIRSALDALEVLENKGVAAEILVIDDASRDGSQKLLRTIQATYDEPRLKTLCLRQNYGQARLWNLACRVSRFRHVCRVDADNEVLPDNLPLFVQSAWDTGAAMVYGSLISMENGQVMGIKSDMAPTTRLTTRNYIDASSIVDAEKILKIGGYTRVHPYAPEDWEMVLHLIAEEEEIVFVPAVLGYYHRYQMSASREHQLATDGRLAVHRIYAQTGSREWDNLRVGRIYHPDVGYVDEW